MTTSRRWSAAAVALCFVLPVASEAQVSAALDAGASQAVYGDGSGVSVLTLSPQLMLRGRRAHLLLDGGFAQFTGDGWSLQGEARGSVFTPAAAGLQLEFMGDADGTTHQDRSRSGSFSGGARLHWAGSHAGGWVGGGVGRTSNGARWLTATRGEAAAWVSVPAGTITIAATPTFIGDSLRFVDGEVVANAARGPLELTLFGGVRHWTRPAGASSAAWGGASAAWWLHPGVALVAAGGGYPADYGEGLPRGRYLSLGVRISTGRAGIRNTRAETLDRLLPPLAPPVAEDFRFSTRRRETTLAVRAPKAASVELMGDFTNWTPVVMTQEGGGWWRWRGTLTSGVHRLNVRVSGGAWGVPRGVTQLTDEFGGVVGLIVTP